MSQELIKLPTNKLLNKFGSGGHTPGSGSAAALLGLVSCKLIQTVVTLSDGRDQYEDVKDQLTLANQNVTSDIEPILMADMQEDAIQFNKVIIARKNRNNEADPKKRKQMAEKALLELRVATEIPIRIARSCLRLAEEGLVVFDLGFQSARGDSGVAISSALSGASGCISIIYLNLTSFRGSEWAVQTRHEADNLSKKTRDLQMALFKRIDRLQTEVLEREDKNLPKP